MKERIKYNEVPHNSMEGLMATESFIKSSNLDRSLIELIKFRVSQINNCAYCLDMHYKEAMHIGEKPERLYSLSAWRETSYYSEKERIALSFTENVTASENVDDELYEKLNHHFSKEDIIALTITICQINSWNRISKVFKTIPGSYHRTTI